MLTNIIDKTIDVCFDIPSNAVSSVHSDVALKTLYTVHVMEKALFYLIFIFFIQNRWHRGIQLQCCVDRVLGIMTL